MSDEYPLAGGNMTAVTRVGATVHRQSDAWTPAVHLLLEHLEHLERLGFDGAPRARGYDDRGREVLTFIEGEAGYFDSCGTQPDYLWSDQTLLEAARLLRRLHDATSSFVASPDAAWQLVYPDRSRHEIICHNDFAPYNCIFAKGHLQAIIDFDMAGPGPRVWDLAYAAYRFVPLVATEHLRYMSIPKAVDMKRRLQLFCDAYGFDQREGFVNTILERIDATRLMLIQGAAAGNVAFQRHVAEGGHLEGYERDYAFVRAQASDLQDAIDAR
ncbi:MAG: phosphotransferase [Thermomicrobiales bacterium]